MKQAEWLSYYPRGTMMSDAREFALKWHGSQMYGNGRPYIEHLDAVACEFDEGSLEREVAYLHDVIEDTPVSRTTLRNHFVKIVVDNVHLLTKTSKLTNREYYERMRDRPVAKAVKLADLRTNLANCILNTIHPDEATRNARNWIGMAEGYAKYIHFLETGRWWAT